MSRKRNYSNEFRLRVVQEYLSGKHGGFGVELVESYYYLFLGVLM